MKRKGLYRLFGGIIFFTFLFNASFAQGMSFDEIGRAMNEGDVTMLARHFGSNVDITINNTQSTYSSVQAELVLKKFFSKNNVRSFKMEQAGKSYSSNAIYSIGILVTNKGTFKVYLYLKPKDNDYTLQQIKIEK